MSKKKSKRTEPQPGFVLEYLRTAPPRLLQAFELARLNHVTNMEKELGAILNQMVNEMAEALLARMMLENRKGLFARPKKSATAPLDLLSDIGPQVVARIGVSHATQEKV